MIGEDCRQDAPTLAAPMCLPVRRKVRGNVRLEYCRSRQAPRAPSSLGGPRRPESLPPVTGSFRSSHSKDWTRSGKPVSETPHQRRESDRAQQRAGRAAELGDHTAYLIATAQAASARRRRAEWELESAGRAEAVAAPFLTAVDAAVRSVLREEVAQRGRGAHGVRRIVVLGLGRLPRPPFRVQGNG